VHKSSKKGWGGAFLRIEKAYGLLRWNEYATTSLYICDAFKNSDVSL